MKYILMFIGNDEADAAVPKTERDRVYAEISRWFGEHGASGKIVGGEELKPASTATTVRFGDRGPVVTDGPFAEAKETIGGYAIVDVEDLDAALALAKTWPGRSAVEVRPLVDHSGSGSSV